MQFLVHFSLFYTLHGLHTMLKPNRSSFVWFLWTFFSTTFQFQFSPPCFFLLFLISSLKSTHVSLNCYWLHKLTFCQHGHLFGRSQQSRGSLDSFTRKMYRQCRGMDLQAKSHHCFLIWPLAIFSWQRWVPVSESKFSFRTVHFATLRLRALVTSSSHPHSTN